MGFGGIDTQSDSWAPGWHENGKLRAEIDGGGLIHVPFWPGRDTASGSASYGGGVGAPNDDGSATGIIFSCAANASFAGASTAGSIQHWFHGNYYGVRFDPLFLTSGAKHFDFGVMIDRIAYRIPKSVYDIQQHLPQTWGTNLGDFSWPVANDLGPGPHFVEISIPETSADIVDQLLWGYTVEAGAGNKAPIPGAFVNPSFAMTNGTNYSVTQGVSSYRRGRKVAGIIFRNAHTTQVGVVRIRNNNTECAEIFIPVSSGPGSTVATTADNTTDVFTVAFNHSLVNADQVVFGGTAVPTGLVAGTVYFVVTATATTFQVAATSGGAAIDISTNGTAVTYYKVPSASNQSPSAIWTPSVPIGDNNLDFQAFIGHGTITATVIYAQ